jgi:hypothetical protein
MELTTGHTFQRRPLLEAVDTLPHPRPLRRLSRPTRSIAGICKGGTGRPKSPLPSRPTWLPACITLLILGTPGIYAVAEVVRLEVAAVGRADEADDVVLRTPAQHSILGRGRPRRVGLG